MGSRVKTIDRLYTVAEANEGYFTLREAASAGIDRVLVMQAYRRAEIERIHRGVYRIAKYPLPKHPDLRAAILWPSGNATIPAVLSHETALALLGITDVNPASIHITIPKDIRISRVAPAPIVVHLADIAISEMDVVDDLPITNLERTTRDLEALNRSYLLASRNRDER